MKFYKPIKKLKININFKNIYLRRIVIFSTLILLLQILLSFFFLYRNRTKVIRSFAQSIKRDLPIIKPSKEIVKDIFNDHKNYFKDFLFSFKNQEKIKRVDLNLSLKSISKLDCYRKNYRSNNTKICGDDFDSWVKGELITDSNIIPIKLRAKGDRQRQRNTFNKMSYKVDIQGPQRFNSMEEFNIQTPVIRGYTRELLTSRILKNEKLLSPKHFYIRLYLNGKYLGLRHVEQGFSKELIESSNKRYGPIFSLNESLSTKINETRFDLSNKKYWSQNNKSTVIEALTILENLKKKVILLI